MSKQKKTSIDRQVRKTKLGERVYQLEQLEEQEIISIEDVLKLTIVAAMEQYKEDVGKEALYDELLKKTLNRQIYANEKRD